MDFLHKMYGKMDGKKRNSPSFCRQNCQVSQLNVPDADGNSPMKLAVDGKHWEVVRHVFVGKKPQDGNVGKSQRLTRKVSIRIMLIVFGNDHVFQVSLHRSKYKPNMRIE